MDRAGLPTRFSVGATLGAVSGGGTLIVDRGAVTLVPSRVTRGLARVFTMPDTPVPGPVVHTSDEIRVIYSRLPTPVSNTVVVVSSSDVTATAHLTGFSRKRLRLALDQAGFKVKIERRWFATGDSLVHPWP